MRYRIAIVSVLSVAAAFAGEVRISAIAVEADTAKAVTGAQAAQIGMAAAHTNRTDNPHGVTAAQIGALTAETDALALEALAAFAATSGVSRITAGSNEWYTFEPGLIKRHTVTDGWGVSYNDGEAFWLVPATPYPMPRVYRFAWLDQANSVALEVYPDSNDNVMFIYGMDTYNFPYFDYTNQSVISDRNPKVVLAPMINSATNIVVYYLPTNQPTPSITLDDVAEFGDGRYAQAAATNAPAWLSYSGVTGTLTLTNQSERPMLVEGTGSAALTFAGLRPPLPLYFVARGFTALSFPGAYVVGSGAVQTNMSNHFVAWRYGTNTLVNLVTATED